MNRNSQTALFCQFYLVMGKHEITFRSKLTTFLMSILTLVSTTLWLSSVSVEKPTFNPSLNVPKSEVKELSIAPTIAPISLGKVAPTSPVRVVKKALVTFTTDEEKQDSAYIRRFQQVAIAEMVKFGIPASISMAQGLLESNAGTSSLTKATNNHFGMKCFARRCDRGHCKNFTDDSRKDFFLTFPNAWESWRAHSKLLCRDHYQSLHKHGKDYKAWAIGLKRKGYATSRNYAAKLINLIERYKLNTLDNQELIIN